jgi:hypothetical protein
MVIETMNDIEVPDGMRFAFLDSSVCPGSTKVECIRGKYPFLICSLSCTGINMIFDSIQECLEWFDDNKPEMSQRIKNIFINLRGFFDKENVMDSLLNNLKEKNYEF